MKRQNKAVSTAIALSLSAVFGLGFLSGCAKSIPVYKDALVIMTEDLNELYNPFYSTAGTDMDVVGNTQISMLSTDKDGNLAFGNDEPTLVLDYQSKEGPKVGLEDRSTEYYFVLKNGLKFSDGVPVTMNDVMFNLYVYLDPTYTGSSTMYSTDIIGLEAYRTQSDVSGGTQDNISVQANTYATNRLNEGLIALFHSFRISDTSTDCYATEAMMRGKIADPSFEISSGYLDAIGETDEAKAREQLLKDYNEVVGDPSQPKDSDKYKGLFRLELERDYNSAKEAYIEEPYKSAPIYYNGSQIGTGFDEIISFMYMEGLVELTHPQDEGSTKDLTKIEKATLNYDPSKVTTKEDAINRIYNTYAYTNFDEILTGWSTGSTLFSDFVAKARDVILHESVSGALSHPSIEGIKSLGHMPDGPQTVNVNGHDYTVARYPDGYNADGSVKNPNEYAVLRIVVDGVDPKAEWNFGFTVAPYHYYSDPTKDGSDGGMDLTMDIANNKFGVEWASFDFHKDVLQGENSNGVSKNKVPLGAGPYVATDENDSDNPTATGFYNNQKVYYKANKYFTLDGTYNPDGTGTSKPKIEHMRYQVISSSNALGVLESGTVHYVEPQFTEENFNTVVGLKDKGIGYVPTWQLGYGYIGVNAKYVKQLGLRKAIMAAMNTALALEYYYTGTAVNISWPMSAVNWAYPRDGGGFDGANPTKNMDTKNGHVYTQFKDVPTAINRIKGYMAEAQEEIGAGKKLDLEVTFTIAGSNMYEHPAYSVFKSAMDILNSEELGWKVTLKPDASALTKLSTGNLEVWAAAWGSTIDPDMYQVYHKDSTATSVKAWGYPEILNTADPEYEEERGILDKLAKEIDDARRITDRTDRSAHYKIAMGYVLDLAVELPLYQRQTMYAYNLNVIKESTLPEEINSYTSPLSRIWEVEFTD